MYAKQRRSRLAAGERGVGCAGVFGGAGGCVCFKTRHWFAC